MAKRNVKEEALQAVYDVCARVGLENLSIKRISEQIHASEAMIYYHYKSKTDILEKAFLAVHSRIDEVFRQHFIEEGLVLERDTLKVCTQTWMLYYGFWRDHPAETAFYDAFIHSHYISTELWRKDNASYVFFASMFGRLMGDIERKTGESVFAFIWSVIIESAIIMAKRAQDTGKDLDEQARKTICRVLSAILSASPSEGDG